MESNLRRRLERLERGRAPRRPRAARPACPELSRGERSRGARRARTSALPPGEEIETPLGVAFRIDNHFPTNHQHGRVALEDLLSFAPELAAEVAGDHRLLTARLAGWAFVDLETTGLAGGAGTLGFLIGVGSFVPKGFRLRQYFMRAPEEEPAMLHALKHDLKQAEGVVSFNGRVFDLPLLEARSTIALRERWRVSDWPHFDLIYPSRRLWRRSLADCRLATLEQHVLQVTRSEADVPGALIPGMYLDYLRTGDASEMRRVIYHNSIDILSLVGLAAGVLDRYRLPDPGALSGEEALAVARWHQVAGRDGEAEAAYRAAVKGANGRELQAEALRRFSAHLKRAGRRVDAISSWKTWHALAPDDPGPCIELAKYYEWDAKSCEEALNWAEQALSSLAKWPADWRRREAEGDINHRIRRLRRKLKKGRTSARPEKSNIVMRRRV